MTLLMSYNVICPYKERNKVKSNGKHAHQLPLLPVLTSLEISVEGGSWQVDFCGDI